MQVRVRNMISRGWKDAVTARPGTLRSEVERLVPKTLQRFQQNWSQTVLQEATEVGEK